MLVAVLLLLALIPIAILVRTTMGPFGEPPKSGEPRCGRCGYIVRGIPTLTCPECGSDLREVGIDTGRAGHGPWLAFLALAAIMSVAIVISASLLAEFMRRTLPRRGAVTHTVSLKGPASGAFHSVTLNASGTYRMGVDSAADSHEPVASVQLFLNDGRIGTLAADLNRDTYSYRTPTGGDVAGAGELDGALVASWMNDCGIDTSAEDVMREAIEIATHVRALPPRSSGSFSQSRGGGPFGAFDSGDEDWEGRPSGTAWSEVVPPTVGLLGWFAALWGLARRYGIMPARDRR